MTKSHLPLIHFRYLKLLKASDGEEYSQSQFVMARVDQFRLVILTQLTHPPQDIVNQCYTIRVHTPKPSLYWVLLQVILWKSPKEGIVVLRALAYKGGVISLTDKAHKQLRSSHWWHLQYLSYNTELIAVLHILHSRFFICEYILCTCSHGNQHMHIITLDPNLFMSLGHSTLQVECLSLCQSGVHGISLLVWQGSLLRN